MQPQPETGGGATRAAAKVDAVHMQLVAELELQLTYLPQGMAGVRSGGGAAPSRGQLEVTGSDSRR